MRVPASDLLAVDRKRILQTTELDLPFLDLGDVDERHVNKYRGGVFAGQCEEVRDHQHQRAHEDGIQRLVLHRVCVKLVQHDCY